MRLEARARGIDSAVAALAQRAATLPDVVSGVLIRHAEDAADQARDLSPVDTGRLRDSWRIDASGLSVSVVNDAPYAEYVIDFAPKVDADRIAADVERAAVRHMEGG